MLYGKAISKDKTVGNIIDWRGKRGERCGFG